MLLLRPSKEIVEFTNRNWPELAAIGGLESIEYEVVDRLPYWLLRRLLFIKEPVAITCAGKVYLRRDWFERAPLLPDGAIDPRFLWAVAVAFWHEPWHVIVQRGEGGWAWSYLWQAVFHGNHEEDEAYANQRRLEGLYFDQVGRFVPGLERMRP